MFWNIIEWESHNTVENKSLLISSEMKYGIFFGHMTMTKIARALSWIRCQICQWCHQKSSYPWLGSITADSRSSKCTTCTHCRSCWRDKHCQSRLRQFQCDDALQELLVVSLGTGCHTGDASFPRHGHMELAMIQSHLDHGRVTEVLTDTKDIHSHRSHQHQLKQPK